jgi:hypothetical protein
MSEPANATRFAEPVPKFGAMSDAELALFIAENERDQIVITEEMRVDLEAGQPRGARWRQAAGRAKGYKVANLKLARVEEEKRKPSIDQAAEKAKKLEIARQQQALEKEAAETRRAAKAVEIEYHNARSAAARDERDAQKAAANAVWERRQARRARMFAMAARKHMTKEECAWLWDAARKMFPDAPDWEPNMAKEEGDQ